jgi:predicted MFS family arabinose efflux permease
MMETTKRKTGRRRWAVSITLFFCLFAGQAAMIAMSPVLANAAGDLHVSTAAAGQLRTIAGLAAGITALTLAAVRGRVGVGRQLLIGSALLVLGSITSAAAPTFALLALAQVPVGVAAAVLTTAGTLAAAEWVSPEQRTHVLSWALLGQPAAWIVGMPVIGLLGESSWRYGWLALPLVAAVATGLLVAPRSRQPAARRQPARARAVLGNPALVRWLTSEVFANAAWAGTLVYAGALFAESYGASTKLTGCVLALAACAYIAGNLTCRRLLGREPRRVLVLLAVLLAVTDTLFGTARLDVATSTALLSGAGFLAGGRTLISGAFALTTPPDLRPVVTSLRAATMQFGYFAGSIAGGAALAVSGYSALGPTMGLLFLAAATTLARRPIAHQPSVERRGGWRPQAPTLMREHQCATYTSTTAAHRRNSRAGGTRLLVSKRI